MENVDLRYRQIHLDFHTSSDINNIGQDFNPEEFAQVLSDAKVNSVTCFSRCHHGYLYYDSKVFKDRIHPNLRNKNMLKEQIEACHNKGIRVPIYITVQWDQYTSKEHPEWLCKSVDGDNHGLYDPQVPLDAGFYQFLCVNSPYSEFLKQQTKEILDEFEHVDGLFYDIVQIRDCICEHCKEGMMKKGYRPHIKEDRMNYQKEVIDKFKLDMTNFIRKYNKDCTIFYNSGHVGTTVKESKNAYTHFELESLPSGEWGYLHFPITMRYARNLGLDCVAMTGKFHTMWGDFHSFKNQAALEFECFSMLALNAKCMIGDQLEPNGKISKPVYDLIGKVYKQVEEKEPWCKHAKAVTDIGVLTTEEFFGADVGDLPDEMQGITRMLQEGSYQFDIVDSKYDFDRYKVIVLPDNIYVDDELNDKLDTFINQGGKIIASFESGLSHDKSRFNLSALGVELNKEQTRDIITGDLVRGKKYNTDDYADYILPGIDIGKGLYETEYVMYLKGIEVTATKGEVLAIQISSYFDRNYVHFCSHRQTPSSGDSKYDAIVRNGNVIYFAHPIFKIYNELAPQWCKILFQNALEMLLPEPILQHNGPSTLLTTINNQNDQNRYVIHMLHYIPERRCKNIDIIEDIIPLYNIEVSVNIDKSIKEIRLVPDNKVISFEKVNNRIIFNVPVIKGHQMIELNY